MGRALQACACAAMGCTTATAILGPAAQGVACRTQLHRGAHTSSYNQMLVGGRQIRKRQLAQGTLVRGSKSESHELADRPIGTPDIKKTISFAGEAAIELGFLIMLGKAVARAHTKFGLSGDKALLLDLAFWAVANYDGANLFSSFIRILGTPLGISKPKPLPKLFGWYDDIKKPWWTPPKLFFPIIWLPLKALQTWSGYLVWRHMGRNVLAAPVLMLLSHLMLTDLWQDVFFREKFIGAGLVVILSCYAALWATIFTFRGLVPDASLLLLPTAAWITVASLLNLSIWRKNGKEPRYPYRRAEN